MLLCNFCQSKKIANFDFDQKLLSFDQNKLNIHQMIKNPNSPPLVFLLLHLPVSIWMYDVQAQ